MLRKQISKLLDQRKPLRKDAEQALTQLSQLAETQPELAELAATNAALLRATFTERGLAALPVPQFQLDPAHAATKLAAGVPLLRGEALVLDGRWLRDQFLALCAALAEVDRGQTATTSAAARREATEALAQATRRGALDLHALSQDVLNGDPQQVAERAAQLDLDAGLLGTLLRWTLLPLLEPLARQLAPLRKGPAWPHGYCPTCGAWPLLAEQRGIEQQRFLRCGLCATDWQIERIMCPFCGSRTPGDMAYLYEEQQQATQRAITCERCHCYYKSVATLVPLSTAALPVTDLATLHLDLIALERAFAPPG